MFFRSFVIMKIQSRSILAVLVFICLAVAAPNTRAVVPTPDGCYPNFTTAEGCDALNLLTTGAANTGLGWRSLFSDSTGSFNTGVGAGALVLNDGDSNTAVGAAALLLNTSGMQNVAVGTGALLNNIDGVGNTAIGYSVLPNNTSGTHNTAIGFNAMQNNETGGQNTAIGQAAGLDLTGVGNVCLGSGTHGIAGVDNTTWIRNVNTLTQNFSAGVNDYVTVRLSDGRLGHTAVVSSRRYKEDIKPLAAVSEALYALNPVSFHLKRQYDETQALGFGLIAEEVE